MIERIFIPNSTSLLIKIPSSYVGKKVHTLVYVEEEITDSETTNQTASDILETSSLAESEELPMNTLAKGGHKKMEVSPLVESLTGVIPDDAYSNEDYYSYLAKKYS